MANTLNKAILIGRVGHDLELQKSAKGEYARFNIAQNIIQNGEETVQWHRICVFGKIAQACQQHLHKGDLCCVEGRIDHSNYEKNGEKHYSNSIIAERVTFLSAKRRTDPPVNSNAANNTSEEAIPF